MALYHFKIKSISRGRGQSIIAKAAYNSCSIMTDINNEKIDYRKKAGLAYSAILNQSNDIIINRGEFWRNVETREKRKDSQLAREFEISLPIELTKEQNIELSKIFTFHIIQRYNLQAADLCLHIPPNCKRKQQSKKTENPHLHLLIPTRDKNGIRIKSFDKNPQEIKTLRNIWQKICNYYLHDQGIDQTIDARTIEIQIEETKKKLHNLDNEIDNINYELASLLKNRENNNKNQVVTTNDRKSRRKSINVPVRKKDAPSFKP